MKWHKLISVFLIFYLFFLQAEAVMGHTHHADACCETGNEYASIDEESYCRACFVESLKPSGCLTQVFFLPAIYEAHVTGFNSIYKNHLCLSARNLPADRGPPAA